MKISYEVDFHPVGQGLFSSGVIDLHKNQFQFVYDCGTTSSQSLLHAALNKIKLATDVSIDLVTISHFDGDHISGLEILLKKYKVQTLLLPGLDLEYRLLLAFSDKIGVSDKRMKFFLDPIEYLTSRYKGRIKHIVVVPPSEGRAKESIEGKSL